MKNLFILLLSVLFCPLLAVSPVFGAKRALVVAVEKYQVPRFNNIHGCVNDGDGVVTLLKENLGFAPEEIRYLKNEEATRKGILGAFDEWLIRGTRTGDQIFFYYAGHGYFYLDDSGDETDENPPNDETICPYDTDPNLMADPARKGNMVIDDEIGEKLARLNGRKIVAVFDSCHSGTAVRGGMEAVPRAVRSLPMGDFASGPRGFTGIRRKKNNGPIQALSEEIAASKSFVLFLSAAAPDEKAKEIAVENGKSHGAFTYGFIRAFQERGRQTTVADIMGTFDRVRAEFDIREQHPQVEGNPVLAEARLYDLFNSSQGENYALAAQNLPPQTDISLWTTHNGERRERFALGETMRFHFRSGREGFLYLFDYMESTDQMYLVYPNLWSRMAGGGIRTNYVSGGETVNIPPNSVKGVPVNFDFEADHRGKERIIALFTRTPWREMDEIVGKTDEPANLMSETQKRRLLEMLYRKQSERLLVPVSEGGQTQPGDWAGTTLDIAIH